MSVNNDDFYLNIDEDEFKLFRKFNNPIEQKTRNKLNQNDVNFFNIEDKKPKCKKTIDKLIDITVEQLSYAGNYFASDIDLKKLDPINEIDPNKAGTTVIVKTNYKCNLNCAYCYDRVNRKKELENKHIDKKIIDRFADFMNGRPIHQWIWHGGEPLMEGIEYYKEMLPYVKNKLNCPMGLQTNGTLINEEILLLMKKYNVQMGASFDFTHNNDIRKHTKEVLASYELAKKYGLNLGGLTVYTDKNIDSLIEDYEYAKKIGVSIKQNFVFKVKRDDNIKYIEPHKLHDEMFDYFKYWVYDTSCNVGVSTLEDLVHQLLGERSGCSHFDCEATKGLWLSLTPEGKLFNCGRPVTQSEDGFGTIFDYPTIQDLFQSEAYNEWYNFTRNVTNYCKKCSICPICHGGCFYTDWLYSKDGKPEPNNCLYEKLMISSLIQFLNSIKLDDYYKLNPYFLKLIFSFGYRSPELISIAINKYKKNVLFSNKIFDKYL